MKRQNVWHVAICDQLRTAGGPLSMAQIWSCLEATGFQHSSRFPRCTLSARVTELVQMQRLERVGRGTYRMAPSLSSEQPEVS